MATIKNVGFAIIITTFLVVLLARGVIDQARPDDTSIIGFSYYNQTNNFTAEIGTSMNTTKDTTQNFYLISTQIKTDIGTLKNSLVTLNLFDAFGAVTKLTLNLGYLLYTIMAEGINLIQGIGNNIENFDSPWNYLANVYYLALVLFILFFSLKIFEMVTGRNDTE